MNKLLIIVLLFLCAECWWIDNFDLGENYTENVP